MAVDKVFLRQGPAQASASEGSPLTPLADSRIEPNDGQAQDEHTLAEVLASLGRVSPAGDNLFAAPSAWLASDAASDADDDQPEIPRLVLTNTLADVAQINGEAIRAGAFVDREHSVRLVRIETVGVMVNGVGKNPSAIVEFSGVLYRLRAGSDGPERLIAGDDADSAGES